MYKIVNILLISLSFLTFRTFAVESIYGPTNPSPDTLIDARVRYFGSVVELKATHEKQYRELHADVWPEVLNAIKAANIHNYHIFIAPLDGKKYLFSFFEYHGNDMKNDFAKMALDETTRKKWWPLTDSYQEIIPGTPDGEQWMSLESLMSIK
jgi:L-rhamnose mutarotase